MTALEFTTSVLKELKIKYLIQGDTLTIYPTSSPMMELLPGDWVDIEETGETVLVCSANGGNLITPKYVAGIISHFKEFI